MAPGEGRPVRTDAYGDRLPILAAARLGTVRLRHQAPLTAICFSPDGKLLASAAWDGNLCLWDAADGRLRHNLRLPGEGAFAWCLVFSPDSKSLASAGSGVYLWDVARGTLLRVQKPDGCPPLAISEDGKEIAAKESSHLVVWDASTGEELHRASTIDCYKSLAFSSRGQALISDGCWRWDLPTGRKTALPTREEGPPSRATVVVTPGGTTPASMVWMREEFNPVPGRDRSTQPVWDAASGKVLLTLKRDWPAGPLALSPDGKLLAGAAGQVRLWEVPSGKEVRALPCSSHVACLAFSADGKRLAVGEDHAITLWDVANGKELPGPDGHQGAVSSLAFGDDGRSLVSAGDATARRWEVAIGKMLDRFRVPPAEESDSWWALVQLWSLPVEPGGTAVSPNGKTVASWSGGDSKVRAWELSTRKEILEVLEHVARVGRFAFSADGKTVAWTGNVPGVAHGVSYTRVRVWDLAQRKERWQRETLNRWIDSSLALAPDGNRLAVVWHEPKGLTIWDVANKEPVANFEREIHAVAFSPDGQTLAVGERRGCRLSEAASGKEIRAVGDHEAAVTAVSWSTDGKLLAAGDARGSIRVWDLATGRATFVAEAGVGVTAIRLAPEGTLLATGLRDTTVLLWELTR
jgi:WD40 repeat protein